MANRLLFADLLKFLGISLVILFHLETSGLHPWLAQYSLSYNFFNGMYMVYFGSIGVSLFIFASGLSLALSHPRIDSKKEIMSFYGRRLLRIYPAYWVAILFAVSLNQSLLKQSFSVVDVFRNISGFQAFGVTTFEGFWGQINPAFWFVGLIVSLYLLFPLVLYAINRRPTIVVISLLLVSVASRYYMAHLSPFYAGTLWFPLCNIFAFGLGVYLIKKSWYPKKPNKNIPIIYLSNLVFYIYLIHGPILGLSAYPVIFIGALLVISSMFYLFDNNVKRLVGLTYQKLN